MASHSRWMRVPASVLLLPLVVAVTVGRAAAQAPEPIRIDRVHGPIRIDGLLDDAGWQDAQRVERWYETNPGDNVEPGPKNVGYLAYDDNFLYAAFDFGDPDPRAIRAPYADHDHISGNSTDYAGIIVDTRNDGHSAILLLASATGIQYDAITDDDGSGEDSSPDFFWESAAHVNTNGWTLELRVPFSSLRYRNADPQTWGILLYRNYPRTFRYQFFSAPLPRGSNCFICHASPLVGLEGLPSGGHVVVAPYATASQTARPSGGPGSPLIGAAVEPAGGVDAKWTPNADNAVDLTIHPDFSQVESDTAQISANERFALSYPEKRPFFLEGVELLATPLRAVYTRAITAPRWGARTTGKSSGVSYTVLAVDDEGGGSVILPGPDGSSFAPQVFASTVLVGRAKRGFGRHFIGVLATDRETHGNNGYNRVVGPDFLWRPSSADAVSGQWLVSDTRTPDRPGLSPAWTGDALSGGAALLQWTRNTRHFDAAATYKDLGEEFRADAGFIPQVGYREASGGVGWTVRPRGLLSRERSFANATRQLDRDGALISRNVTVGAGMDTRGNGFVQFRYLNDLDRASGQEFTRQRFAYVVQFSPSRRVAFVSLDGTVGEEVDFENGRPGHGATVNVSADVNPTDHLEVSALHDTRWVDVDDEASRGRLFTARVSRVRATYTFTARSFVRVITQYTSTDRDPTLYLFAAPPRTGVFSGSVLLAYKINWQSVIFVGYGDDRALSPDDRLEPADRQIFVKVSYAFQR
jgi:hypothetical protein